MFNLVQLNAPDPEREGHNHMRVRRPARGALFDLFFERGLEIGSRDVELEVEVEVARRGVGPVLRLGGCGLAVSPSTTYEFELAIHTHL